jgi:hypothetical protein
MKNITNSPMNWANIDGGQESTRIEVASPHRVKSSKGERKL